MQSSHIAMIAMAAIVTGGVLISMVLQAILGARRKPEQLSPDRMDALEKRLSRIEQSIDAVAIEIERISEGQRFTTKLLSERVEEARKEIG